MVDNFKLIESLIQEVKEDHFYFVQLLRRRKDGNSENGNNKNRMIKAYFIDSVEKLREKKAEILEICNLLNCRAMIHLNPRSFKKIALKHLSLCAEQLVGDNYKYCYRSYATVCGRDVGETKSWIVDLDDVGENALPPGLIEHLSKLRPTGNKVISIVPSKKGCHLICKPFDLQNFHSDFPLIDVHKNNPTNLFIP